jgi:hypothetical protein
MKKFRNLALAGITYNLVILMWILAGLSALQVGYFKNPVSTVEVAPTIKPTWTLLPTSLPTSTNTPVPTFTATNTSTPANTPTSTPVDIKTMLPSLTPTEKATATIVPTNTSRPKPTNTKKVKVKPTSEYPSDITAVCKDGSYSYSKHASGTCSRHGGVRIWVNKP